MEAYSGFYLWFVWKGRNDRIFQNSTMMAVEEDVVHLVFVKIAMWASSRRDFDSLRIEGILHNWEASLYSGTPKESIMLSWQLVPSYVGV